MSQRQHVGIYCCLLLAAGLSSVGSSLYTEREVEVPLPKRREDATNCQDVTEGDNCKFWAGADKSGCVSSPGHMSLYCPKTCSYCHLRNAKTRCDPLQNDNVAMQPGGLEAMFIRLMATPAQVVQADGSLAASENEFLFDGRYTVHLLSRNPWIVAIDDVLSEAEADALIEIAHETGFTGSTTTGEVDETGTINRQRDASRTSMQAWCQGKCDSEPLVEALYSRIAHITTVPPDNYEHLQLLKYETGQKYSTHHDLLGLDPVVSACGPRILTFFLYLSDVEEGGETNFPNLDMAVVPKKGRAVLWPNVLDSDLETQEPGTMHEARPVLKGRKFAANSWIHLKDYRFVNLWACSG